MALDGISLRDEECEAFTVKKRFLAIFDYPSEARFVIFFLLNLSRTIGVRVILMSMIGWDTMAVAVVVVFWGIPVLFVTFTLGFFEVLLGRYGTYVTSLGSVIPLILFHGGHGDPTFFSVFSRLAIWLSIMWIASGLLVKIVTSPLPPNLALRGPSASDD
jgi:hypothetical protein